MQIVKIFSIVESICGGEHSSQGGISLIKFFGYPACKIVGEGFNTFKSAITIRINFCIFFGSNTFHYSHRESVFCFAGDLGCPKNGGKFRHLGIGPLVQVGIAMGSAPDAT